MRKEKPRIIFVGMPDMALVCLSNLLENGFNIVGVVPPKKNHETYNYFKDYVLSRNLNLLEYENSCNDSNLIMKIKELNADIGVVCSFNYLLSKEFLSSTKFGYINCHPSLLPQYRGAAPYFHIVNNGEKKSGITLHFMDETFDTGDVVYQEEFDILPFETMGTLFNRTNFMLADGLVNVLGHLAETGEIKSRPQEKSLELVDAPKVDGNFRIRWNKTSIELERLIRACNPFYSAFCYFRGVSIKVLKATAYEKKHNLEYGKIALANDKEILVATKDGYLSLEVLHVSSWGIFKPQDFYYTFSPQVGEILE